jgi:hypothetical protein
MALCLQGTLKNNKEWGQGLVLQLMVTLDLGLALLMLGLLEGFLMEVDLAVEVATGPLLALALSWRPWGSWCWLWSRHSCGTGVGSSSGAGTEAGDNAASLKLGLEVVLDWFHLC